MRASHGLVLELALYCQLVKNVVEQALGPSRIIEDRRGGVVLSKSLPLAGAAYVDNFAVFGLNKIAADSQLDALVDGFGKLGLPVHEITPAATHSHFVGLDIDRGIVSLKPSRLRKLRMAVRAVLRRRAISGDAFRVIAGHLTWAMMTKRESLAILNAVYRHITGFGSQSGALSSAARRELWQVSAILPLLRTDTRAVWDAHVHASDASPTGIDVCARMIPPRMVGLIGRCSKRWRFLTETHLRARQSALGLDPHAPLPAILEQAEVAVALEIQQFEEVLPELLDFEPWDVLHVGKLSRPEHISRSEGRGLLWAVAHTHRTSSPYPRRMPAGCRFLSTICRFVSPSPVADRVLVIFFTLSER